MVLALAVVPAAVLAAFTLRRLILLAGALLPRRPLAGTAADLPSVTVVVPAYNEAATIEGSLDALDRLDYPAERLHIVLVNDGSDDGTGERLARWAAPRPRTQALQLERIGKASALDAAIAAAPPTDLVAVCDADVRLRPDYLRRLAGAFADDRVGAAVGFVESANALASPIACYATVEMWVHQLVTSAGKDRLDLNPPLLGSATVFRRTALEDVGGFGRGPSGDDMRTTVALTRAGWRTRFVSDAVADNVVASRSAEYWRQHVRWARNLLASAHAQRPAAAGVPLGRRLEAWMLSAGYSDRLALVAVLALATGGVLPLWLPATYLAVATVEVACAVVLAGAVRHLPRLLFWTAALFALDVVATVTAAGTDLLGRPRMLPPPRRRPG